MDYQTIIDQRFKDYHTENQLRSDNFAEIRNNFGDGVFKFTVDKFNIKLPVSKDVDSSYNTMVKLCEIVDKLRYDEYNPKDVTEFRLPYPSKKRVICSIRFNVSSFTSIVVTAYKDNLFHIYFQTESLDVCNKTTEFYFYKNFISILDKDVKTAKLSDIGYNSEDCRDMCEDVYAMYVYLFGQVYRTINNCTFECSEYNAFKKYITVDP
jgi:hypothetical protein